MRFKLLTAVGIEITADWDMSPVVCYTDRHTNILRKPVASVFKVLLCPEERGSRFFKMFAPIYQTTDWHIPEYRMLKEGVLFVGSGTCRRTECDKRWQSVPAWFCFNLLRRWRLSLFECAQLTDKPIILVPASDHGYFVASWWRTPLRHPPKVTWPLDSIFNKLQYSCASGTNKSLFFIR
jgi:hypothetical protein